MSWAAAVAPLAAWTITLFATRTLREVRCKNAKFAAYAALSGVIG